MDTLKAWASWAVPLLLAEPLIPMSAEPPLSLSGSGVLVLVRLALARV